MLNCIGNTSDTIFANISYITDIGEYFIAGIINTGEGFITSVNDTGVESTVCDPQLIGTFSGVADHGESSWKVAL